MSLRALIRREVEGIVALDALEVEHIALTLAWIDSDAELCRLVKPATPSPHLVAYFVCVDVDQVLLVDHKKAERWLPTGGHVDPGEHPRETVRREAREELDIDASFLLPHPLLVTVTETVGHGPRHTDISLWYALALAKNAPLRPCEAEFHEVRWFPRDAVPPRSDPHLPRFLTKLLDGCAARPLSAAQAPLRAHAPGRSSL